MNKQAETLAAPHDHMDALAARRYGVAIDRQRPGESIVQAHRRARRDNPGYALAMFSGFALAA
jgi:hypothetical protein